MRQVTRFRLTFAVLAVCFVALAGCSTALRQPSSYGDVNDQGDGYYGNFMFGCTGVEPTDGKYVGATLESPEYCTCVFEGMKDNVPFSEAKDFEDAQADTPEGDTIEIPDDIRKVMNNCEDKAKEA